MPGRKGLELGRARLDEEVIGPQAKEDGDQDTREARLLKNYITVGLLHDVLLSEIERFCPSVSSINLLPRTISVNFYAQQRVAKQAALCFNIC